MIQLDASALLAVPLAAGTFIVIGIAVPLILPLLVPLSLALYWVRGRYMRASREVKRLESTTRSPVVGGRPCSTGAPPLACWRHRSACSRTAEQG